MMHFDEKKPLILASNSPQRKRLLEKTGIFFDVIPSNIDEVFDKNKTPSEVSMQLAKQKAENVVAKCKAQDISFGAILAADTIVSLNNKIYGKPQDYKDAFQMISELSQHTHSVITGFCIYACNKYIVNFEETFIEMKPMTDKEIQSYMDSVNVLDKAGAIDIETIIDKYVLQISGDFDNVIGLPINTIISIIKNKKY